MSRTEPHNGLAVQPVGERLTTRLAATVKDLSKDLAKDLTKDSAEDLAKNGQGFGAVLSGAGRACGESEEAGDKRCGNRS